MFLGQIVLLEHEVMCCQAGREGSTWLILCQLREVEKERNQRQIPGALPFTASEGFRRHGPVATTVRMVSFMTPLC